MIYTGIGSRDIPKNIGETMFKIGAHFAQRGFILRSGGATGSDHAFERGSLSVVGSQEIYLPWKSFGKKWDREPQTNDVYDISDEAMLLAKELVEQYKDFNVECEGWVWKMIARNMYQVLGHNLDTPSNFVVCYTPEGKEVGGTRWAIRLAKKHHIPIFNLGSQFWFDHIKSKLED